MTERSSSEVPTALIMKGGGIKGLAYVGAIRELQPYVQFNWFIGTSAGAIVAVLLGAGYTIRELEDILRTTSFKSFLDANPVIAIVNLFFFQGLYRARTFTKWLDDQLARKLKHPFRIKLEDLPYRVTVYACRRDDDPLRFDKEDPATRNKAAAFVARCSMSIPFLFAPEKEEGLNVLDGGMRYNYPVRDTAARSGTPFIGLYLGRRVYEGQIKTTLIGDILNIWAEASDVAALREYREQTIIIDPRPISTLDFSLDEIEKDFLLKAGRSAALEFLARAHPELSELSHQAELDTDQARQRVINLRLAKRTRFLRWLVLILAIAGTLVVLWRSVPGRIPSLNTFSKVTRLDLADKRLLDLVTENETAAQANPQNRTVICKIDWTTPYLHGADFFSINVDAQTYDVSGFVTGRANRDEDYAKNKRECRGAAHRLSCVVSAAYRTAYIFLTLRSPDNNFDTGLPCRNITSGGAGKRN
jgi:predicted acylesterase/phospholipase RssA